MPGPSGHREIDTAYADRTSRPEQKRPGCRFPSGLPGRATRRREVDIPPEVVDNSVNACNWKGQEISLNPRPFIKTPGAYGLAVDIGTTKLAAYLVRLETGETVAQAGAMNPQIAFGEDVISRIAYAECEAVEPKKLQAVLIETLNHLLAGMCTEADVPAGQVLDAVLVGNTAMHHLFAGLPVEQLGRCNLFASN